MEKEMKRKIVQEFLAVLQKHDCTFAESKELLMNTVQVLESKKVQF